MGDVLACARSFVVESCAWIRRAFRPRPRTGTELPDAKAPPPSLAGALRRAKPVQTCRTTQKSISYRIVSVEATPGGRELPKASPAV
jgi:hypothetical protein